VNVGAILHDRSQYSPEHLLSKPARFEGKNIMPNGRNSTEELKKKKYVLFFKKL
jgi:hypothetical protein